MLLLGTGDLSLSVRRIVGREPTKARSDLNEAQRRPSRERSEWLLLAIVWTAMAALFWWTTAVSLPALLIGAVVVVAASYCLASSFRIAPILGVALIFGALSAAAVIDTSAVGSHAPLHLLLERSNLATLGVSPTTIAAAVSAIAFLTASSNEIVRAVGGVAKFTNAQTPSNVTAARQVEAASTWFVRIRAIDVATVHSKRGDPPTSSFRGGRVVGPLERFLVVTSLLAGVPVVIAGIVAAKGAVRFPEISADKSGGVKAEEFLVGTLCSLLLAGLAAFIIASSHWR